MNLKPNISMLNALIRITCGLSMLACVTARMVRKPWKDSYYFWGFLSAMKVAEGIVRFCPITYLCQVMKERNTDETSEEEIIHNPT